MKWGDLISLEYGKPVNDKASFDGSIPVYGTNGQIGTSHLPPLCPIPSFIVGRKGAYRGVHYSPIPFSVIDTAFYALPKSDSINLKWAYYKFLTYDINRMDSGSAIPSTDRYEIYGIDVELPDIKTQNRIVKILDGLDDKIAINQQINKNLEEQAQAIFEKAISTPTSSRCALSDIAELNPKRTLSKGVVARCVDMAQLSTSVSFPNGWEYKPFNGGMRFCNGDTLLARITPCLENGKTAYINFLDNDEVAFGSTEYIVMSSKGEYPNEFFYCLARWPEFIDYAVKNMNGTSGRQRVSAESIGRYELPKLNATDMQDFRNVVPQMFNVCCNNSIENIRLAAVRDALLPRLMSGEIDVSEIKV